MQRRTLLALGLAAPFLASRPALAQGAPGARRSIGEMRSDWRSFLPPGTKPPSPDDAVKLSAAEWKQRLGKEAFEVLREEGTEYAFSSPLDKEKRRGVFVCAGCDLPLFTSEMKYDSGTGWPSFFTTIPGVFRTREDNKIFYTRIEYHCARCGGHHGHVFRDGPPPTRERWCNNGVALRFLPA